MMISRLSTLQGRFCLVTGATSGIGKALATELARQGATVAISGRDSSRARAALGEIKRDSGSTAVELLPAELLSVESTRRLAADYRARFPRLDVLVNNAGGLFAGRTLSHDGFEATFALNVLAPFVLTHELLGHLRASAPSRVLNVAAWIPPGLRVDFEDLQQERGYNGLLAYGRAKLALMLLTRAMGWTFRDMDVLVNSFHPGVIPGTRLGAGLSEPARAVADLLGGWVGGKLEDAVAEAVTLAGAPELKDVTTEHFVRGKPAKLPHQALATGTCRRVYYACEAMARKVLSTPIWLAQAS